MSTLKNIAVAAAIAAVTCIPAAAQQATPPYGAPISLEQAEKVIAAAEAEANVSGMLPTQDGEVANAGAGGLK